MNRLMARYFCAFSLPIRVLLQGQSFAVESLRAGELPKDDLPHCPVLGDAEPLISEHPDRAPADRRCRARSGC
jgi:hypothetical protein